MVTLLAKNAVQIKCGFENAIMTGNYECAYALGVLCAISGQQQYENYGNIIELKKKVFDNMGQFSSDDKKIKRMVEMLEGYEPSEQMDNQMEELYSCGFKDQNVSKLTKKIIDVDFKSLIEYILFMY